MDFPGGSITNVRVIDGFSNIYWRIYTEEPNITNLPAETPANGYTILKHLSRLKDLELRLRNLDCLVSSYPRRLGLWVFSCTPNFENLSPLCSTGSKDEPSRLLVGSATLKVSASGSVTSKELVKTLSSEPQNATANSTASQRPQNGANPPRRMDGYSSSVAIYASFISAITGALSLQLIRRNSAILLGSRTLFTVVENDYYGSPRIVADDPASVPSLTTLQVQLTSVGKLTVALQTISQPGIIRLSVPNDNPAAIHDAQPGTDVWLSPSGTITRLVTTNPESPNISTPYSHVGGTGIEGGPGTVTRKQWKTNVLDWLGHFGLPVNSIEEEIWVEVEVWEPFYSRLSGEIWRQNEEHSSALPLKRILWPARYCFIRKKSTLLDSFHGNAYPVTSDPLEFAEVWYKMGRSEHGEAVIAKPLSAQEQQLKEQETPSSKPDFPDCIESLSRAAQYPDFQTASLVYPTPPDGAFPIGLNPPVSSDALPENSDLGSSLAQSQIKQNSHEQASTTVPMGFGPSAGLTVGSGLYDNDDDDLFGEMNDREFGSKGITDADFSFFDDPDFSHIGGDIHTNVQETPSIVIETDEPIVQLPPIDHSLPYDTPITEKPPAEQMNEPASNMDDKMTDLQYENPLQSDSINISSPQHANNQTISPPLSPVEIKKILFPGPSEVDRLSAKKGQVQSHYNPVAFTHHMSNWNQKYGAEGKFSFTVSGRGDSQVPINSTGDIPTIGLPRRSAKMKGAAGTPKAVDKPESPSSGIKQLFRSISDSSSDTSDDSDGNISDSDVSPAAFPSRKRKRARSNSGSSVLSQERPPVETDHATTPRIEDSIFLGNFLSTFSDWSMTGYFSVPQNQIWPVLSREEVQIQVAQLLVDQVTQSSLDHKLDGDLGLSDLENEAYSLRTFLEDTFFMGEIERLDLNNLALLQDNTSDLSPPSSSAMSRQASQRKETGKSSISKLSPPHMRVRRGKDYLEALPPALSFWETFGLEPAYGSKDISAYCIHPHVAAGAADAFLERFSLLYSSCNLGYHIRGDRSKVFDRGMCSWDIGSSGEPVYSSVMQSLKSICEKLGTALVKGSPTEDNIVIYIINPFTHAAALADICSAFWGLFQKYLAEADKQQAGQLNEVVLQIVPISFIMSTYSLVMPPQAQYLSLALEVYSRCPPKALQSSLVDCAPPVLLAEPVPKAINFKLAAERSSPLQEGRSLHIAFSKSLDQRWISVAWSDNTGTLQRTMSYCLRFRDSNTSRSVSDIRSEIWGVTNHIMDKIQARWRVIVVNTEPVDQEDLDTWTNLAEQHNKTRPVPLELIVLNVNTTPELYLEPPPLPMPMSVFSAQVSATPVATPNPSANVLSPDQSGNAPTPPSGATAPINASTPTEMPPEAEPDSLLTDICDESWAVILSHRLNSSPHLTEYRPALASGYLLRRKGITAGDGVFAMNVNLLYTQRPSSSHESLLKEILGMYRDLATLARTRGTRNVQRNTMPWHIATAIRAQEMLSYIL